jgi:thioredoxin-like negative regulator of GroEL
MFQIGINSFNDAIFEGNAVILFSASYSKDSAAVRNVLSILEKKFFLEKVDFYEIDVDEYPEICQTFGIQSIPSVGIFSNSKAQIRIDGVRDGNFYKEQINKFLF